jgi:hypothetical protein
MSTQASAIVSKPSIWSAIGHFFHNVEVVISDAFVSLFGADAAHNFAAGAEALIKTQLGQLALAAVTEAQALAAGTDKRAAAFSKITADATSAGLQVKDSIVNMLIELCLQKVKGSFGAV